MCVINKINDFSIASIALRSLIDDNCVKIKYLHINDKFNQKIMIKMYQCDTF